MSIETVESSAAQIQESNEEYEKWKMRAKAFDKVFTANTATMIVGSAISGTLLGPLPLATTLTMAVTGRGISSLFSKADLNDNKMAPQISPAESASTLHFI